MKIIRDFQYNLDKDREARDILLEILNQKPELFDIESILKEFETIIHSKKNILIYGCGPSLEGTVMEIIKRAGKVFFHKNLNIAADGAAVFLDDLKIPIDSIFTDLDGITENEFLRSRFLVIHAHGDNIDKLLRFKKEILHHEKIIGTTQVEPIDAILNPGGFTDGDRILFLLRPFLEPNQKLFLIGMDFDTMVGRYSKPEFSETHLASPIKVKKLRYAIELIEWMKYTMENEIYFVNSKKISDQFTYLSLDQFQGEIEE